MLNNRSHQLTNIENNMSSILKRTMAIVAVALLTISAYAQKDVTKFLGIPVDGSEAEMINQLKSKGFELVKDRDLEYLSGKFNGEDVMIFLKTNNGKVWRVAVCDANYVSEPNIRIRFNNLLRQFENNGKYLPSLSNTTIPETEDISYEIAVKNKRYEACFYQIPEGQALEDLNVRLKKDMEEKFPPEDLTGDISDEAKLYTYGAYLGASENRQVWFIIGESFGKYNICLFYDNTYNMANGEDL